MSTITSPIPPVALPMTNPEPSPFSDLRWCRAFEELGPDFSDPVRPGTFDKLVLRYRNDEALALLGLDPAAVSDDHLLDAFGRFKHPRGGSFLAMRYVGYQFQMLNLDLGDGRGFLYGQIHARDGRLLDLGTKGTGTTPYSRGGDGRLTLKGAVREMLASESLHALGVTTSRTFCVIETGDALWRGDEPSPTRGAILVRMSHSHIRFGTFERHLYFHNPSAIPRLLDHVVAHYYPHLHGVRDRAVRLYQELVERIAQLAASWTANGFVHGVLNTDNMSMTGESFDYGPYGVASLWNPRFTAAYFDGNGLYSLGRQGDACLWNLERLGEPLAGLVPEEAAREARAPFHSLYRRAFQERWRQKLGLPPGQEREDRALVEATEAYLERVQRPFHLFFTQLTREGAARQWRSPEDILAHWPETGGKELQRFRGLYYRRVEDLPPYHRHRLGWRMRGANPDVPLLRPHIEAAWADVFSHDHWDATRKLFHEVTATGRYRSETWTPCRDVTESLRPLPPAVNGPMSSAEVM